MPAPTVVLIHGESADSASFAPVTGLLLDDGLSVLVPAVPNRGLTSDAAYIAVVVRRIPGPVLLVGHSYGGAVVTVAGVEENVVGLVYLAGYALEEGESVSELQDRFPDAGLGVAAVSTTFPADGAEAGADVFVAIERFHDIVAHDVDPDLARVLAVSQRPLAAGAFVEKASAAAWKTKPSWGDRVQRRPLGQPRCRAVLLSARWHDDHRDQLLAPGHAVPPDRGGRRHPPRIAERPRLSCARPSRPGPGAEVSSSARSERGHK